MSKNAEYNRIQNGLNQILSDWNKDVPFAQALTESGHQFMGIKEMMTHKKFIPNSIIIGFQDNPDKVCFYTKNGINLMPIHGGLVDKHPHKDQLTEEDATQYGFWDAESFIKWFEEYDENDIVCVKMVADLTEEEEQLLEDMGN